MMLGYVHEIIHEGQVVHVEDESSVLCKVNNAIFDTESGNFVTQSMPAGESVFSHSMPSGED